MKEDNKTKYLIKRISTLIATHKAAELAYIFGSILKEDDFRDIDVAILVNKNLKPYEQLQLEAKLGKELERAIKHQKEVDVKILNFAPISFQYEVIRTGKPIFVKDKKIKVRYECQTLSAYLDYRDVLEFHNQKFLETK